MGTDVGSNDIRRLLKSGDGRGKVSLVSVCVRLAQLCQLRAKGGHQILLMRPDRVKQCVLKYCSPHLIFGLCFFSFARGRSAAFDYHDFGSRS